MLAAFRSSCGVMFIMVAGMWRDLEWVSTGWFCSSRPCQHLLEYPGQRTSTTARSPFPKSPHMVSCIEPKTHGMRERKQFTELAIHVVVKIAQSHLDPFLKVSLQKGPPILVQTIDRYRFHFLPSNVPIHANGFKDKFCSPLHSLTKPASFPF